MELSVRLRQLSELRGRWSPPSDPALQERRRAYAAWCNAGIEGNPLPWPRARALLSFPAKPAHGRAERELLGCLRALEFVEDEPGPISIALLRHLHSLLMRGLDPGAGSLRDRPVRIAQESGPEAGRTVFAPPHPARVPELLGQLLATLAGEEDPFLLSGRFHYEFQSIHPFEDGNGRLGRLLSTLLARCGWPSSGFYLAPAIARAGSGYYIALRAVRPEYGSEPKGGLTPWLLPFCDMLEDALLHPDPPEESHAEESRDAPSDA